MKKTDKQILLDVGDGPEGIEIYTSEDEGVVDWSTAWPALYVVVTMNGVMAKFGPFSLPGVYEALKKRIR